jgi:hypothetical protein
MALLGMLVKKKITEERFSQIFVNSLISTVEQGFADVAGVINDDPEFATSPGIDANQDSEFLMIVLAGNIRLMGVFLDGDNDGRVKKAVIRRCSEVFECDSDTFHKKYREYCDFMSRVNHPSKNVLYSMSRAVFYKYNLNSFQADYFKTLNTPNPIFLKRMNEVMSHFLWDWDGFNEKYRIQ